MKEGYDYFEFAHVPPKVAVCQKQYLVNVAFNGDVRPDPAGACPMYAKVAPEPQPRGSGSAPVMVAKFPTQGQPAVQTATMAPPPQAPVSPVVQTAAARPAAAPVVAAAPAQRAPVVAASPVQRLPPPRRLDPRPRRHNRSHSPWSRRHLQRRRRLRPSRANGLNPSRTTRATRPTAASSRT